MNHGYRKRAEDINAALVVRYTQESRKVSEEKHLQKNIRKWRETILNIIVILLVIYLVSFIYLFIFSLTVTFGMAARHRATWDLGLTWSSNGYETLGKSCI